MRLAVSRFLVNWLRLTGMPPEGTTISIPGKKPEMTPRVLTRFLLSFFLFFPPNSCFTFPAILLLLFAAKLFFQISLHFFFSIYRQISFFTFPPILFLSLGSRPPAHFKLHKLCVSLHFHFLLAKVKIIS